MDVRPADWPPVRKVMHMSGHWWGRALAVLGLLVGAGVIAAFAYHAGTLDSGAMAAQAAQAAAMHAGGPDGLMYGRGAFGHGGGFFAGFFLIRILLGVFFLFLLLRIARFAFFGPRHWGGWGYGPGWGGPMGSMGPGGMHGDARRAMLEEWHRTAHAEGAVPPHASTEAPAPPVAPAAPDDEGEHRP